MIVSILLACCLWNSNCSLSPLCTGTIFIKITVYHGWLGLFDLHLLLLLHPQLLLHPAILLALLAFLNQTDQNHNASNGQHNPPPFTVLTSVVVPTMPPMVPRAILILSVLLLIVQTLELGSSNAGGFCGVGGVLGDGVLGEGEVVGVLVDLEGVLGLESMGTPLAFVGGCIEAGWADAGGSGERRAVVGAVVAVVGAVMAGVWAVVFSMLWGGLGGNKVGGRMGRRWNIRRVKGEVVLTSQNRMLLTKDWMILLAIDDQCRQ